MPSLTHSLTPVFSHADDSVPEDQTHMERVAGHLTYVIPIHCDELKQGNLDYRVDISKNTNVGQFSVDQGSDC